MGETTFYIIHCKYVSMAIKVVHQVTNTQYIHVSEIFNLKNNVFEKIDIFVFFLPHHENGIFLEKKYIILVETLPVC